jgi:multicomponent Na+:H+ antiporter subunit C
MNLIISIIIGILFGSSIFLMLHRSFFKLIVGVFLFGYGTIFFLFSVSGITKNAPPIIAKEGMNLEQLADPLPQALTLTAIVIAIGVQVFVIILLKKVYENVTTSKHVKTEDLDDLTQTDKID